MKWSDWSGLLVGLDKYKNELWGLTMHGKKTYRNLQLLEGGLNESVDDLNYVQFSRANKELKLTFNEFRDFVGNIIYSSDNDEAKENFHSDMKTISKKLDLAGAVSNKLRGMKKITIIDVYSEMWNTLHYMFLFLKRAKGLEDSFEEGIIYIAELMGGREIGKEVVQPSPNQNLLSKGGEEEGESDKETEINEPEALTKEGMKTFMKTAKEVEGSA